MTLRAVSVLWVSTLDFEAQSIVSDSYHLLQQHLENFDYSKYTAHLPLHKFMFINKYQQRAVEKKASSYKILIPCIWLTRYENREV